jgi:hypothetical protein
MKPYLRAAWNSFTWHRVLLTQVGGLAVAYLMSLDWGYFGQSIGHVSIHFVTMSAYAFLLLPVAFIADEAIARGVRPIVVYVVLLVFVNQALAAALCAAMQWIYTQVFAITWPSKFWGFTDASGHFSVPSSLGLLIFLNGRATERMLESRLATAEAQIDPQMLFGELAEIKRGLENSQPDAEKRLNDLIQTLRTALARTRAVTTEGNEP